jgi:hypothetical protein
MAKETGPSDKSVVLAMLTCGIIGALIGFGMQCTLQGACLGAGIGALTPIGLMILGSI